MKVSRPRFRVSGFPVNPERGTGETVLSYLLTSYYYQRPIAIAIPIPNNPEP